MSHSAEGGRLTLIPVVEEMLEISMSLPDGWTVEVDGESRLACVADETWERDGFRPSVTVERHPYRTRAQVSALAQSTLATMQHAADAYPGFQFCWGGDDDPGSDRIVRSYEFTLPGTELRVRQVQALVAGEGLLVVNCTEAADPPRLEETFTEIIRSVSQ